MTSHRSRFLTSLSERLEIEFAARERERDDPPPSARLELTDPAGRDGPSPEEMAGDEIGDALARPAARMEPEQDTSPEAFTPAQRGHPPPITAFASDEEESALRPRVAWSETGMPLRLREAIASVRRFAHEMQDAPLDDDDDTLRGPPAYGDQSLHDGYSLVEADAAAYQERPPDEPAYEEPLPRDRLELFDQDAGFDHPDQDTGFDHPEMRLDHEAAFEEHPAADDLVRLDAGEGAQLRGHDRPADDELAPDDGPAALDEDASYAGPTPPSDDSAQEQLGADEAGSEQPLGDREDLQHRPPLRPRTSTRYGVPAAALAIAIAVVALAGFGLGVMSGGRDVREPLARDGVSAAPRQPAPSSSGREAPTNKPERAAELPELATVRVAPVPVAAAPDSSPDAPVSTSGLPLPPPPKPALPPSATDEVASPDHQRTGAVNHAAAAPLESERADGTFEPLFAKLPSLGPTVSVHYTANAVGAPATALHLVRHLKAQGFAVEAQAVAFPIPTYSIRYFFDNDREQAERLRSSLEGQIPDGATLPVMDFTSYEPRPRPGLIEVWLRA